MNINILDQVILTYVLNLKKKIHGYKNIVFQQFVTEYVPFWKKCADMQKLFLIISG